MILATPVYYYNISAQLKAFIDRNHILYAHGQKAKAKVVGIIVIASAIGIEDTLSEPRCQRESTQGFSLPDELITTERRSSYEPENRGIRQTDGHFCTGGAP